MNKHDRIRAVANRLGDAVVQIYFDPGNGAIGPVDKQAVRDLMAGNPDCGERLKELAIALFNIGSETDEEKLDKFFDGFLTSINHISFLAGVPLKQ